VLYTQKLGGPLPPRGVSARLVHLASNLHPLPSSLNPEYFVVDAWLLRHFGECEQIIPCRLTVPAAPLLGFVAAER